MPQAAPPQVSSAPGEGPQRDPKSQLGQDVSICNMSVEQADRGAKGVLIPTQPGSLSGHLLHRFFWPSEEWVHKELFPKYLGIIMRIKQNEMSVL